MESIHIDSGLSLSISPFIQELGCIYLSIKMTCSAIPLYCIPIPHFLSIYIDCEWMSYLYIHVSIYITSSLLDHLLYEGFSLLWRQAVFQSFREPSEMKGGLSHTALSLPMQGCTSILSQCLSLFLCREYESLWDLLHTCV